MLLASTAVKYLGGLAIVLIGVAVFVVAVTKLFNIDGVPERKRQRIFQFIIVPLFTSGSILMAIGSYMMKHTPN